MEDKTSIDIAYNLGYSAAFMFYNGGPKQSNPYTNDTDEYDYWDSGFSGARNDCDMEDYLAEIDYNNREDDYEHY